MWEIPAFRLCLNTYISAVSQNLLSSELGHHIFGHHKQFSVNQPSGGFIDMQHFWELEPFHSVMPKNVVLVDRHAVWSRHSLNWSLCILLMFWFYGLCPIIYMNVLIMVNRGLTKALSCNIEKIVSLHNKLLLLKKKKKKSSEIRASKVSLIWVAYYFCSLTG